MIFNKKNIGNPQISSSDSDKYAKVTFFFVADCHSSI
jgi:hypothetical protein